MAARKTGGLGRGLDALIPNKDLRERKKKRKHRKNLRQNVL